MVKFFSESKLFTCPEMDLKSTNFQAAPKEGIIHTLSSCVKKKIFVDYPVKSYLSPFSLLTVQMRLVWFSAVIITCKGSGASSNIEMKDKKKINIYH